VLLLYGFAPIGLDVSRGSLNSSFRKKHPLLVDTQYPPHTVQYMVSDHFESMRMELRRGSLVFAVLLALREEAYGYSLRKNLSSIGLDVDEGTLYPLIRRLESQELLSSRWSSPDEPGRKKRYYQTSTKGMELIDALKLEWNNLQESIDQLI